MLHHYTVHTLRRDLGWKRDKWGVLSSGCAIEAPLPNPPSILFMAQQRFRGVSRVQISRGNQQKNVTPSLLALLCFFILQRKWNDVSIKALAPYTLGKIAVRFVTFK